MLREAGLVRLCVRMDCFDDCAFPAEMPSALRNHLVSAVLRAEQAWRDEDSAVAAVAAS